MELVRLTTPDHKNRSLTKIAWYINTPSEQNWGEMFQYFMRRFSPDIDEITLTSKDNIHYKWSITMSTDGNKYTPDLTEEKEGLNKKLAELNENSEINSFPDRYEISDLKIIKRAKGKNTFTQELQFIVQRQNLTY